MERQRSFSFKPTRLLFFSFTISSSLLFLTFFSIWVFRAVPSIPKETHLILNTSYLNLGFKPIEVQSLTGFLRNLTGDDSEAKNSILGDGHVKISSESSPGNNGGNQNGVLETTHFAKSGGNVSRDRGVNGYVEISSDGSSENASVLVATKSVERNVSGNQNGVLESAHYAKSGNFSKKGVEASGGERVAEKTRDQCDVSKGRWVYDESYPLYTSNSCPFVDEGFSCEANGRPDRDYMKWRWQPHHCNTPRFNAVKMLESIKGKRLVFVGDSINRNQWESMLCLLFGAIKDPKRVYETHGRRITKEKGSYSFKFVDYRCTVEFYVTHFLVHESKARVRQRRVPTLRLDAVDRGSSRWRGADILVFNTAHWWSHYKTKSGVNYYQEGDRVHPHLDVLTAFRKALITWASWVDKHINPSKTQVFFRSSAPSHFRGGQWNTGGHCKEGIRPLNNTSHVSYPERNLIVEEVLKQMRTPVTLLNVTSLSEYRIDGHPSIYGRKPGKMPSSTVQDCSHWCLPGVPDTWNELLYFYLQSRQNGNYTI